MSTSLLRHVTGSYEAFMRRFAAPKVKPPQKDRTLEVRDARKLLADGLSDVGVESLRDALESWGAEWTGYVSEWDWQHIARQLLEYSEDGCTMAEREEMEDEGASPAPEPDLDANERPVKDADGWEDMMDGKIRKRTVKEGKGEEVDLQRDVLCSFDVRLSKDGEILQKRKNMRYRIGESEAIPGLELALRHMVLGEEAEVSCISRFAWGPAGCRAADAEEKDVPADADAAWIKIRAGAEFRHLLGIV
eukprot:symbB.v1.2.023235.t1/scaffold2113.1/size88989/1